ncbi:MAG: CHAT domain-containing protein [Elainellaceae cyanobacterium]
MGQLLVLFLAGILTVVITPEALACLHGACIADLPSSPRETTLQPYHRSTLPIDPTAVSTLSPQALFQQGLDLYQAERFADAVEHWDLSARLFAERQSQLNQALALAYLSLGHQSLGQLSEATAYLAESRHILDSEPPPRGSSDAEIYAKVLNIEGMLYWLKGQIESALTAWQESGRFYQEAGQLRGMAIAQMNQAKALQALGLSLQAESLLRQVYEMLQTQPELELRALSLQRLGAVLRQLGDLETAHTLLQDSLALTSDAKTRISILVELGNTDWEQGDRLQAIGQSTDAQSYFQSAQRYYQQALSDGDSVEARLNLLGLLVNTAHYDEATHYLTSLPEYIERMPLGRQRVYAAIHMAQQWIQLADQLHTRRISDLSSLDLAQLLSQAVQEAQRLDDRRAESYALGQLGQLYEHTGQYTEAQQLTQDAQFKLEGLDAPEIQYRWAWQLGQIAKAMGDRPLALTHYDAAVSTLETVRSNLLGINADVQFSFRDNVEPVYREFVELLLTSDDTDKPSQQQLEQAIHSVDQLQLAELENYLGCQVANIGQVRAVQDETAAIIYPIVLRDRLAIITQFPGQAGLSYYETTIAEDQINAILQALRVNLTIPDRTPEVIEGAKHLYDWLIRPLEPDLHHANVQTLVFVLDGALRNVPMAVLFDGEQYLIQKGYAVAIAPRLELFLPNETSAQLRVNLGGVGIPQEIENTTFPTIVKVEEELNRISQIVEATSPLLNESFTVENIKQQLQQDSISAIHWKTHGIFSSDPSQTFIVGFNQRINTATLNELIGIGSQGGNQPLELLVLSACETAQGDNRAVLGLAGLAARTGTRSVLSTLWIALDTPNTELMVRFYESLVQKRMTKAEALRQAQLALINEYGYTTPYIWANYTLIGNWL